MRIYQGVAGRGGVPYGEQATYTLMKAAGEEEAATETEPMEPDAEIPKDEPTEPESIEEPVEEATPEPEPEPIEDPSVEAAPMEEEAAPESPPEPEEDPVVEEAPEPEPIVEEEEPEPTEEIVEELPTPEPIETGSAFTFEPESPHVTDGLEPVIVNGQVRGITTPGRFYVSVVRKGSNGTTIQVADAPLRPEGARTATSHSW